MSTNPTFVRGTAGADDIRATSNPNGSQLAAGAGDDILRGGKFDDILIGGSGSDQMFGGAGADQFRFFADQMNDGDVDKIRDVNFADGDVLVFGKFALGTFADATGLNAFTDGTAATVSSIAGLVALVNLDANDGIFAERRGTSDTLILHISNGTDAQTIELTGLWTAYNDAQNLLVI